MNAPHRPRKRFGQNFLHDANVIAHIVAVIDPRPGQHMVEIGPGKGALTRPLLQRLGALDVVELDRDLVPLLQENCAPYGELRVHQGDALRYDFRALAADGTPLRVVGNLPYNISTPLLFHLLSQIDVLKDMHFMLQKEVVDRMAAPAGGDDYGRLSVTVQYYCAVERLFIVRPGSFFPAPRVDSAVVRLVPHATPPVEVYDKTVFDRVVAQAFSLRRKTLRNALKGMLMESQISAAGVNPQSRPEVLTLEEFARLSNIVEREKNHHGEPGGQGREREKNE